MINENLPANVYALRQSEFRAIPGNPWVYKINKSLRSLFVKLPLLNSIAKPRQGLASADNFRFIKKWWEVGYSSILFNCISRDQASKSKFTWFPCMKNGANLWYSSQIEVVNWLSDGKEMESFPKAYIRNANYYFLEGAAYSSVTSSGLSFRWMPPGYICEHASNAIFSDNDNWSHIKLVGLFNSALANYIVGLNETINVNIDDLLRMPVFLTKEKRLEDSVKKCISIRFFEDTCIETFWNFIIPLDWLTGLRDFSTARTSLQSYEAQIDNEIYSLYGVSDTDRKIIEAELAGSKRLIEVEGDIESKTEDEEEQEGLASFTGKNLALSWLTYTIGIILGRFQPGTPGALGSAIYRRSDFAIGSLPEPSEEEFNELVGDPSQFAYIDEQGGRHVFSRQVEDALRKLALPDGIAVFDPNHPRDLPSLVSKALELMLGQVQAQEVIQQAAGGDLRKYLEKDFFTQHHIKQYRKRPVYWPIQSAKRSYGFVLFHEKIDRNTFYALQQEPYLPTKRRAVQLRLEELGKKVLTAQGAARKPIEKEMDELRQLGEELAQFAKDLDAITRGGYEPEADWIDDGVILRMAPLWSVIPLWKSEPKKYWEELAAGKYDWSRIAMHYWPERVKQACKKNKSYAIAHGHEEWYEGG